ncbi:hypothetical protein EDD58_101119 [Hazenella coriacea]|uniref:Uncharacterized protein n=1 Tax=Hazenella coriacea TaxID=1179467 RepID=A0A4R3LG63_9BACL|nr:hypothetical protein EDD58_101119 [Hazenella coriacea]
MKVDISIIKRGGVFDNKPFIQHVKKERENLNIMMIYIARCL